jgi:hypothetical protein
MSCCNQNQGVVVGDHRWNYPYVASHNPCCVAKTWQGRRMIKTPPPVRRITVVRTTEVTAVYYHRGNCLVTQVSI